MKAGERGELLTPTVRGKMLGCCFVVVAARGWWMEIVVLVVVGLVSW